MKWCVSFLLKGLPKDYAVSHASYRCWFPQADILHDLEVAAQKLVELQKFLIGVKDPGQISFFSMKLSADQPMDAFRKGRLALESIIDVYGLMNELTVPEIADLVVLQDDFSPHAVIQPTGNWGAAQWQTRGQSAEERRSGNSYLAQSLLQVMGLLVSDSSVRPKTELEKQIGYSCAIFTRSISPGFNGVEFLGKFAALEGLVCGGEQKNRRAVLIDRISLLFKHDPSVPALIAELWEKRNDAVHQAQLFYSEKKEEGQMLSAELGALHDLFVGVLLMAMNSRAKAQTVSELWLHGADYEMPAWAKKANPRQEGRSFVTNLFDKPGVQWRSFGETTDRLF